MLFEKNKKKVVLFYLLCYIALFLFVSLLSFVSVVMMFVLQFGLILLFLAFLKLIIAEIRQTVQISDETLVCKSFIVNGGVADAEIPYEKIEKIEVRKKYLFVYVYGEKPFAIRDNYINYPDLCKALFEKCKNAEIVK